MSLASDSSEIVAVIIIKLGTVTVSDMRMDHVLSIVTLTFIQGHSTGPDQVRKRAWGGSKIRQGYRGRVKPRQFSI